MSITNYYVTADTYVYALNPNTNYGGANELYVDPDGADEAMILLYFDLSSIPSGTPIYSATLSVYKSWNWSSGTNYVRRVTSSWTENGATWSNKPNLTTQNQGTITTGTGLGWYTSSNISAIVQGWVNGTFPNYGLYIDSDGSAPVYRIYSKEYSGGSYKAYLTIDAPSGAQNIYWIFSDGTDWWYSSFTKAT